MRIACLFIIMLLYTGLSAQPQSNQVALGGNLPIYRTQLLTNKQDMVDLEVLLRRWEAAGYTPEQAKSLIEGLQVQINWFHLSPDKLLRKIEKGEKVLPFPVALTEADIELIERNVDLMELTYEGVLRSRYPYQLTNEAGLYDELRFYRLKRGLRIGEVGAGSGTFSLVIALLDLDTELYVNDLYQSALDVCRAKFERDTVLTAGATVKFVLGKKRSTEFAPASLDRILVRDSYHHFTKPKPMLASIKASLAPGGELYLREYFRPDGESISCVQRISEAELKAQLTAAGFVLDAQEWQGNWSTMRWLPVASVE